MSGPYAPPDTLKIVATVDGIEFPYITSFSLKHTVNGARTLTCGIQEVEGLELCRLGSVITIEFGRGSFVQGKKFTGIIKIVRPSIGNASITAIDYVSQLANSEYVDYKAQDYVGEDLYFAAASAANYKTIDVSRLTRGSGLIITEDMNLWGWQTRKGFIDKCFGEMIEEQTGTLYPNQTFLPWFYAIHEEKYMEFFQPDHARTNAGYSFTISQLDQNITDEGVVAQIDTTRIFNSVTAVSKDDSTLSYTYNDEHSIQTYGVQSKRLDWDTSRKDVLENVARSITNRFKTPTKSYTITLSDGEWMGLGDIVEITAPGLSTSEVLPVVAYDIVVGESLKTAITLGERQLSIAEYLERLG